jgi:EmrB/QacA subfamily drug resistance transporter
MSSTYNNSVKKVTLIVVTMASFLTPFMGSSINIALPPIGKEFGMDAVLLAWVPTSFLLSVTVLLLPMGRLADIYGRKRIFTCGIALYTIFCLFSALSNSGIMLISARVLQGIGSAMIYSTSLALITSTRPVEERGRALGIYVAVVYLGLSLGPFLGGVLTHQFGWRSIFLVNVPLGIAIITLLFWKLKQEWAEAKGEKFDLPGSIIYGFGIIAVMYGLSLLPEIAAFGLIIIGILCFLAFAWWEIRTTTPILQIRLFRSNKVFTLSNFTALVNYSATYAIAFLLSLYLQYIKGFSPQTAGIVLLSMPVVQVIFSPLAGRLSDKITPQVLASSGMAVTTAGLITFVFLDQNTGMVSILITLLFLGLGFAFFASPNTNAVMSSVEGKTYGVASAILATMRQIGMMLSMGIAMLVFTIFIGRVEITPEYYMAFIKSTRTAFIIFAVLCFIGIFASLIGRKHKKRNEY